MADQFTEVSEQGFGSSLMDSIKGVLTGGLLFLISFPVLWWNEGRTDPSDVAKKAIVVKADSVDKGADGKLISVAGDMVSDEAVGDPEFLKPGKYLRVHRQVEMYAWVEKKESKTEKKLGGGKRTETTYTYERRWTSDPVNHDKFREPRGHENPSLPIEGRSFNAKQVKIGAYSLDPERATLPAGEPLSLSKDIIKDGVLGAEAPAGETPADGMDQKDEAADDAAAPAPAEEEEPKKLKKKRRHGRRPVTPPRDRAAAKDVANKRAAAMERVRPTSYVIAGEKYLFRGNGSLDRPLVGDIRVSFQTLASGKRVTFLGKQQGAEIVPFQKDDVTLFRAFTGSQEEAVSTLATEHKMITWILRIVGFLMMWFGLSLFFGPINAILDIIPFLGSAGRFIVGIAMLPVSILLSTVVILLSIIAHSPILLVLTIGGLGAGGYFLYQKKKAQKMASRPQAPPPGQAPQWQ
jgi:hypothetical protein